MRARALARRLGSRLEDAGIPDSRFEAELLVRSAGRLTRARFFLDPDLGPEVEAKVLRLGERRARRMPAAYLLHEREFFGLSFLVGPEVLIPRPESELLVEFALEASRRLTAPTVVDVGTGSGAIAIAVAVNLGARGATVVGTDISREALALAARNRERHGAAVELLQSDLLGPVGVADVVIANLPYIPTGEIEHLEPEIRSWEPRLALDGGPDGLRLISRLIADCGRRLRGCTLALEVGAGFADRVEELARRAGATVTRVRDLAGIERVVVARWR